VVPVRHARPLQAAVAVCGLVPVGAGMAGMLLGPEMMPGPEATVSLDSHFRYLSGLLLGIGLAFWSLIPDIVVRGREIRLLTSLVVVGGVGRLIAVGVVGVPSSPMLFGLGMELLVTPLLCLWQARVAARVEAG
jgi:hypothetical protein